MRLTQFQKDAFIRAVMDDVPNVDFKQEARDLLQKHFVATAHPKLRAVYDDEKLRVHIEEQWVNVDGCNGRFYFGDEKAVPVTVRKKVAALIKKHKAQETLRNDLQIKLRSTVAGISTRKRLVEALPEFEKYAPAEFTEATPNLPAIANVVSDFVRAGWPKGEQPTANAT